MQKENAGSEWAQGTTGSPGEVTPGQVPDPGAAQLAGRGTCAKLCLDSEA